MFNLKSKSVVIIANLFNPSIFNTHWFIKNDILKEEDLLPKSIFTQDIAQISTNGFNMVVTLNQLITNIQDAESKNTMEIILKCIKNLPHTPYSASGINFHYHTPAKTEEIDDLSRELFFFSSSPVHSEFDTKDAKFGAYLSKDYEGCRLKLDIKPNTIKKVNDPEKLYVINFGFNFHIDLPKENYTEELIKFLNKWNTFEEYSKEIMGKIF